MTDSGCVVKMSHISIQAEANELKFTNFDIPLYRDSRFPFTAGASPPHPERLWDPPSLLSIGYQRLFPWG